ncbi:hypothetical protein niasHT_026570 [Heterodera trifolii]|uniref:Uncharacterized protein n=1 Tax=Heterodera trifolii TaxID=157864 RepID=A0ABD2KS77_9BILA
MVKNLHGNWYSAGLKAIIGKLGNELYKKLRNDEQKQLEKCLDNIEDKRDLVMSSQCLTKFRKNYLREMNREKMKKEEKKIEEWKKTQGIHKIKQTKSQDKLLSRGDRSAIFKVTNLIDKFFGKNGNSADNDKSDNSPKWTQLYDALVRIKMANDQKRKMPGARVYEMRMYDLVLARNEPSLGPKEKKRGSGILKMGIQLLNKLRNATGGANSNFKMMSPRFVPLLPEAAEEEKNRGNLSPTILALYDLEDNERKAEKGTEEAEAAATSLPQLLRALGVTSQDRDSLLHTLLDVSGSIGHVQKAMELLKSLNFFEIENDLTDANNRIVDAFSKMEQSFDDAQRQEMQTDGWTFLRQFQYDQLCTDQYAQLPERFRHSIDEFSQMPRETREAMLWKRIERISRNIPDEIADKLDRRRTEKNERLSGQRRRKRRQLEPIGGISVLSPIMLRPFMFSPTLTPSVLGPLVLSPNIFSPIILAPSVLSPFVLSPSAPMPLILSPYVLSPYILSPMAMAPVILTPYVLSPNILNPFAMSPLILSPTVLSPDILSPQILGGAILSPTVGSPAILTETFLAASVLSPSVLS